MEATLTTPTRHLIAARVMRSAWQIAARCVRAARSCKRRAFLSYSLHRAWFEAKREQKKLQQQVTYRVSIKAEGGASTRQLVMLTMAGGLVAMTPGQFLGTVSVALASEMISAAQSGNRVIVELA